MDEKTFRHTGPFASVTVVSRTAGNRFDADASSVLPSPVSFISNTAFLPWPILVTGTCAN